MKKIKDIHVFLLLTIIMLAVVFISVGGNNIYGSMTDWVMQHTVFPDYFRTLFYSNGDIVPNLALNMGAGQNTYYFSYNGLLNPFVILSYLFPFAKMIDYIMIISILIVIVSAFLIYKWLTNNKFDQKIAIVAAILFLLINAFFHAHRHIMFIDYMPFLILGLIGIDKYFNDKKSYLYIISVFLIIMCSYYYSVGSLLCLLIYGIYKYIKTDTKKSIKAFFVNGFKFLIPMFTGITMSFILLVPTVFAIIASRSQFKDVVGLDKILIPNFNFSALLYSNYGMGFTSIAVVSLIYVLFFSRAGKRFLSSSLFVMLIVPVFMYLMNGMLYLRDKVFIPMSPLVILLIAIFLTDLKEKKINFANYVAVIIVTIAMAFIFQYYELPFYLDIILTSIGVALYMWKKNMIFIYVPLIIIALCSSILINKNDIYVLKDTYNKLKSSQVDDLISEVNKSDQAFYRMNDLMRETSLTVNKVYNADYYQTSLYASTFNPTYKTFYDNIINNAIPYRNKLMAASASNIMFQTLMGIKYVITDKDNVPIGYSLVNGNDNLGIYKNDFVLPLGYSSSSLMSDTDFDKLDYPYRGEALLSNVVIDKTVTSDYVSTIVNSNLKYDYTTNINIKIDGQKYIIDTSKDETITFNLNDPIINKVLFVRFKLNSAPDCKDGDISIDINNITNKLTCKQWLYFNDNYEFEYVISSPEAINELNVTLSKGHFEIENIEVFSLDYEDVKNSISKVDRFIVDKGKTLGDVIEGQIEVTKDGYFATTIPYDKGFTVYVNGKQTSYEMVNKAFVGFPITKGTYNIKLVYTSPGYDMGVLGSILGLLGFIVIIIMERKRK